MSPAVFVLRLLLPLVLVTAGCSTGFEREWKKAAVRPPADPFAGRWEGQWVSAKHRNADGRLRGILTPISPTRYHARFKADWMIFSSSYKTVFDTRRKGNEIFFRGSEDLGALFGGVYTFEGRATPEHFNATYDSSYDTGTFEMRRVAR